MPIRFPCPGCGAQLSAPDEYVGKNANCKKCGGRFTIPAASQPTPTPTPTSAPTPTPTSAPATSAQTPTRSPVAQSVVAKPIPPTAQPTSLAPASVPTSSAQAAVVQPMRVVAAPVVATTTEAPVLARMAHPTTPEITATVPAPVQPVIVQPTMVQPAEVVKQPAKPQRISAAAVAETATTHLTPEQVSQAFTGVIAKAPLSIGYKLSLAAVSFLMVLLPLIYIGLIALIIYGAVQYSIAGLAIFEGNSQSRSGRRGGGLVLLYLTPLVIATITVIFMIKPFFARMPKAAKPRSVSREEQPILFDFVQRICLAVGAPMPKRIDIDTDVNASASFRNGWLSLLQPNDLVLTIGMPLVKGLTVRELGGIFAHEFGHFSQGMGMRLTYIIRSINMWFARVVYQRDRADEWLAGTAKNSDIRVGIVLYLAMAVVWLTRRVLWLLMMLGHLVSCMLMRQMEYDADSYEIQFAGTKEFGGTFNKLQRLGLAYQQSIAEAQEFFVDGKLVDDLPNLVRINRNTQTAEEIKKLEEHVAENKGNWLDTHPTDTQRIAAAEKMNAPGVFNLDAPAEALFIQVDQLSKRVTRDFFEAIFGDQFKESMLASVQQLTSFKQAAKEAEEARKRMFSEAFTNPRAMHLGLPTDRGQPPAHSLAQLKQAQAKMAADLAQYEQHSKQFDEIDSRWLHSHQASALLQCGMKLKPDEWKDLPVQSQPLLDQTTQQAQMELAHMHEQLLTFEQAFAQRVDASLQWLFAQVRKDPNAASAPLLQQAQAVLKVLASMDQMHRPLVDLRNNFVATVTIFGAAGDKMTEKHVERVKHYGDRIKATVAQLNQSFANVPYPFEHAGGPMSMSQYLAPEADKVQDYGDALNVTDGLLKNYQYAYFRSIGTLAAIIEKIESPVA